MLSKIHSPVGITANTSQGEENSKHFACLLLSGLNLGL
jgi:hypothetical protein